MSFSMCFRSKSGHFWSKFSHFRSKLGHMWSKFTHFWLSFVHLWPHRVQFQSKLNHFWSKFDHFLSKFTHLWPKFARFCQNSPICDLNALFYDKNPQIFDRKHPFLIEIRLFSSVSHSIFGNNKGVLRIGCINKCIKSVFALDHNIIGVNWW